MSKKRKAIAGAAIGAGIGWLVACFITITTTEPRFFIEGLITLGIGAVIGGAVCGAIAGIFSRGIGMAIGSIVGGIVGGLGGCLLAMFAVLAYASTPWPSPQPYPGVEPYVVKDAPGSWGLVKSQTYTADVPLDELQKYYEGEMDRYCEGIWQFEPRTETEYSLCHEANCGIRRFWMAQEFEVSLCTITPTQTAVTQVDSWED